MKKIEIKYHADIDEIKAQPNGDWFDLRTAKDIRLRNGESVNIPLGVSMKLPKGYEALVIPRSSTFKSWGLLQTNHCGLIDNSYCGDDDIWQFPALATRDVLVPKNTRICQFRIQKKMPRIKLRKVAHLVGKNRGGFGTSGVN